MSALRTRDELRAEMVSTMLVDGWGFSDVADLDALLAAERAATVNRVLALLLENGVINELMADQVREAIR